MRINTANAAIRESLPIIQAADPNGQRIKLGYTKSALTQNASCPRPTT